MKAYQLHSRAGKHRRYRSATKQGELADGTILENVLDRQFEQEEPGKVFATDVTYIQTKKGWMYLAVVLDLCTHEVVVYETSMTQDLTFAMKVLKALRSKYPGKLLLHSDQGALYTSKTYRRLATILGIKLSYSRRGNCWDNAVVESWNGTLKKEWMYHQDRRRDKHLLSPEEATREIFEYCKYYNEKRPHSKLKYRSPKTFRRAVTKKV